MIVILENQFGPHHMERCEALGIHFGDRQMVHGVEICRRSRLYQWQPSADGRHFQKHTLWTDKDFEDTWWFVRLVKILRTLIRLRAEHVFVPHYSLPDSLFLAITLRLLRRRVYAMNDSKFDDKPRSIWRELIKMFFYAPYNGALASGRRTEEYFKFLGFRRRPVVLGYATISLQHRIELVDWADSRDERAFGSRRFVLIGRFVEKKDIGSALSAYARYRQLAGESARDLDVCGAGPLEEKLLRQVAQTRLEGVVFHGFLHAEGIARVLTAGLALIVPSVEEQWGLVVNEALAFCLPILATDQVGARDLLIRTGVNGYIFEPGNVEGLAQLMYRLSQDEAEWRRLAEGSRQLRELADVERFTAAVQKLIEPSR